MHIKNYIAAVAAMFALSATPAQADPHLKDWDKTKVANPIQGVGADLQTIVFRANGVSQDAASFQMIDIVGYPAQCDGTSCTLGSPSACLSDPDSFNRSPQRQQEDLSAFVVDSWGRFGVNIADPSLYIILPYAARADVGIMAIAMSGADLPAEGAYVDDCGNQAIPLAPGYPPLVAGSYRIDAVDDDGGVVLNYRLERLLDMLSDFRSLGNYLITDETGYYGDGMEGRAQFVSASTCTGTVNPFTRTCSGTTHHNIWNTISWEQ